MRYYSDDYKARLKSEISRTKESVSDPDYTSAINNITVPFKGSGAKTECMTAAKNAQNEIFHVKARLESLYADLERFYSSADDTANAVLASAQEIKELIMEANNALIRIDSVLNGVGTYQGTPVSAKSINAVGFNKNDFKEKKENIWDKILKNQKQIGDLNADAMSKYINRIIKKLKQKNYVTQDETDMIDTFAFYIINALPNNNIAFRVKHLPILSALNEYYTLNRYDYSFSAEEMSERTRKACVSVYEILNPNAAKIVDDSFKTIRNWWQTSSQLEVIDSNINIIKYNLYTTKPNYRKLILSYLPKFRVENCSPFEQPYYAYGTLCLYLTEDCRETGERSCSFFHEFGHALDDILVNGIQEERRDSLFSNSYRRSILDDFENNMDFVLRQNGINLTETEKFIFFDFVISKKNVNISTEEDPDYYKKLLPGDWGDGFVEAYSILRDYYGYRDYIYLEAGEGEDAEAFTCDEHSGFIDGSDETTVSGDLLGALTNLKFGSIGSSHGLDPNRLGAYGGEMPDNNKEDIKNVKALKKLLRDKTYWAQNDRIGKMKFFFINMGLWFDGEVGNTEFFAESFDDKIHEIDQTENKKIFPSTIATFEHDIEEIADSVE